MGYKKQQREIEKEEELKQFEYEARMR